MLQWLLYVPSLFYTSLPDCRVLPKDFLLLIWIFPCHACGYLQAFCPTIMIAFSEALARQPRLVCYLCLFKIFNVSMSKIRARWKGCLHSRAVVFRYWASGSAAALDRCAKGTPHVPLPVSMSILFPNRNYEDLTFLSQNDGNQNFQAHKQIRVSFLCDCVH